jgi:Cu/Ag efflux protein CusF
MTALRFGLALLSGMVVVSASVADEARGRIVQIDPDKKVIRLEGRGPARGAMLEIKVGLKTEILIAGQPAKLEELTPGQRIRVVFERQDGKPVAQVIRSLGLVRLLQQQPAPRQAAPQLKEGEGVAGTLQRIGLEDREIVVFGPGPKGPQTETIIAVPEKTDITRNGKKIALDDLKEGEAVTVKTEKKDGKLTAVSIQVGQATAAANPPATMPRRDLIPRLRQALKLADELLREMEERGPPPNPERP